MTTAELRQWFDHACGLVVLEGYSRALPADKLLGGVPGIYAFTIWRGGEWQVVYVGRAVNIRGRISTHRGTFFARGTGVWRLWLEEVETNGGTLALWTRQIEDPAERAFAELRTIQALQPWYNAHMA